MYWSLQYPQTVIKAITMSYHNASHYGGMAGDVKPRGTCGKQNLCHCSYQRGQYNKLLAVSPN